MSSRNVTYPANSPRLTWSVAQAAESCGLSIRSIWAAIADGRLASVTVGRRRLIPDASLRKFLGIE
jgi:excisionase family DNA binding protein